MFKRVIPLEMQIGLLAGSHVAMSLLKSLIICLKEFEEEENVAVFRWTDEKEQYHHTPTSSTRNYQVMSTSLHQDNNNTHSSSTSSASLSSGRRSIPDVGEVGEPSTSSVDHNNNDVSECRYRDYVHL